MSLEQLNRHLAKQQGYLIGIGVALVVFGIITTAPGIVIAGLIVMVAFGSLAYDYWRKSVTGNPPKKDRRGHPRGW